MKRDGPSQSRLGKRLSCGRREALRALERSAGPQQDYEALANCSIRTCANKTCLEVCAYGDYVRARESRRAARRLLKKAGSPAFEVRVGRECWQRSVGKLHEVSVPAAAKLIRRTLDRLLL